MNKNAYINSFFEELEKTGVSEHWVQTRFFRGFLNRLTKPARKRIVKAVGSEMSAQVRKNFLAGKVPKNWVRDFAEGASKVKRFTPKMWYKNMPPGIKKRYPRKISVKLLKAFGFQEP